MGHGYMSRAKAFTVRAQIPYRTKDGKTLDLETLYDEIFELERIEKNTALTFNERLAAVEKLSSEISAHPFGYSVLVASCHPTP